VLGRRGRVFVRRLGCVIWPRAFVGRFGWFGCCTGPGTLSGGGKGGGGWDLRFGPLESWCAGVRLGDIASGGPVGFCKFCVGRGAVVLGSYNPAGAEVMSSLACCRLIRLFLRVLW